MSGIIIAALVISLAIIAGWHLFLPLLGISLAITGTLWGLIAASIAIFCTVILLLFLVTGIGAVILGGLFFIWVIIAIALFPILLPILLPLFIIFLVISYIKRKQGVK